MCSPTVLADDGVNGLVFLSEMESSTGYLAADMDRAKGADLQSHYNTASPFPHVVIDEFLPPGLLEMCLEEFPATGLAGSAEFDRDQERYKTQFNPDALTARTRTLFYAFNSKPFIRILENITGIRGLIPDPYFLGAGLHEVANEGHLSIHADFNHHKPMILERRINFLIYQ